MFFGAYTGFTSNIDSYFHYLNMLNLHTLSKFIVSSVLLYNLSLSIEILSNSFGVIKSFMATNTGLAAVAKVFPLLLHKIILILELLVHFHDTLTTNFLTNTSLPTLVSALVPPIKFSANGVFVIARLLTLTLTFLKGRYFFSAAC